MVTTLTCLSVLLALVGVVVLLERRDRAEKDRDRRCFLDCNGLLEDE